MSLDLNADAFFDPDYLRGDGVSVFAVHTDYDM